MCDDGSIRVQGCSFGDDGISLNFFFQQFTSSGQLDTNFGGGIGSLSAPEGVYFNGFVTTTLSNGTILASGMRNDGSNSPVVVAYTSSGVLNSDFGTGGMIIAPEGVITEWINQFVPGGPLLISDLTCDADGRKILTTTFYTLDGKIDASNPAVVTTAEPEVMSYSSEEAPLIISSESAGESDPAFSVVVTPVMYIKSGAISERTVALNSVDSVTNGEANALYNSSSNVEEFFPAVEVSYVNSSATIPITTETSDPGPVSIDPVVISDPDSIDGLYVIMYSKRDAVSDLTIQEDTPAIIYSRSGGINERAVTQNAVGVTSNGESSGLDNSSSTVVAERSPSKKVSYADSFVIFVPAATTTTSPSLAAVAPVSESPAADSRDVRNFDLQNAINSSAISGISALKLATVAASATLRGSADHLDDGPMAADEAPDLVPSSFKEAIPSTKKPLKAPETEQLPDASTAA